MFRRGQQDVFGSFLCDVIFQAGVDTVALSVTEMDAVIQAAEAFALDFDDAYQYAVAERYTLAVVSFDGDFDRTDRGRRTPNQLGHG